MQKIYIILKTILIVTLSFNVVFSDTVKENNELIKNFITLVDYALIHSPEIKKATLEIDKFAGEKIQAGAYANPELGVEVENFGGTMPGSTFNTSESTISISQKFETGGKRKFRKEASNYKLLAVKEKYKSVVNQSIYDIFYYYCETTKSQKQLKLAKQMEQLSEDVFNTINQKVNYGKTSPVEQIKAGLELERSRIKLSQADNDFKKFEKLLFSTIGANSMPFNIEYDFLDTLFLLNNEQTLRDNLLKNPILEEIRLLQLSGQREIQLAKSFNVPDINFSVGYRKFRETDDNAYVASIGVEIPIFNRNKGLIMEKVSENNSSTETLRIRELQLKANFENHYREMLILKKNSEQYQNKMLPSARKAYEAVLMGYKAGKFNYLDMLDSMRTLIDVENESIESSFEFNEALGMVLKITGYFSEKFVEISQYGNTSNNRGER